MATTKVKKKSNGYNYKYTELSTIHEELERQGITYYQYTEYDKEAEADYIYTVLKIEQKESSPRRGCRVIDTAKAGMNAAQAQGSGLTYARRYSLLMALGWATEDDDGASVGRETYKKAGNWRDAQGFPLKGGASKKGLDFEDIKNKIEPIDNIESLENTWRQLINETKPTPAQLKTLKSIFAYRRKKIEEENG